MNLRQLIERLNTIAAANPEQLDREVTVGVPGNGRGHPAAIVKITGAFSGPVGINGVDYVDLLAVRVS